MKLAHTAGLSQEGGGIHVILDKKAISYRGMRVINRRILDLPTSPQQAKSSGPIDSESRTKSAFEAGSGRLVVFGSTFDSGLRNGPQ